MFVDLDVEELDVEELEEVAEPVLSQAMKRPRVEEEPQSPLTKDMLSRITRLEGRVTSKWRDRIIYLEEKVSTLDDQVGELKYKVLKLKRKHAAIKGQLTRLGFQERALQDQIKNLVQPQERK